MKKICVVTGTRAEYGIFYPLLNAMKEDSLFELKIVATGMHLSPEFGLTYREIEKDGFTIDEKVEMLLSSDTETGISKSIGIGILTFANVFERMRPDLLVVLGDRFETFAAALSAYIARIPIAHLHGGELTEGVIDEALRHSITKMSYLHFTSADEYRKRVIQMGESPERVFNVGALGLDNIRTTQLLSKTEIEERLNFKFGDNTVLITYHPVTLENSTSEIQFRELLKALDEFRDLRIIFTQPNADTDGRIIIRMIDEYVKENPERVGAFASMGRLLYLSAMKNADAVVGNSSSAIIETPSFHKPSVNIGDRQKGRMKAASIIDCRPLKEDITAAIKKALSGDFRNHCMNINNPYGNGNTTEKIVNILKNELSKKINLKKAFFNLKGIPSEESHMNMCANTGEDNDAERYIYY
jgi:GDP/UDP-N,N'-diacetylbacillosamine 2-epimerase (hydrolysing)